MKNILLVCVTAGALMSAAHATPVSPAIRTCESHPGVSRTAALVGATPQRSDGTQCPQYLSTTRLMRGQHHWRT